MKVIIKGITMPDHPKKMSKDNVAFVIFASVEKTGEHEATVEVGGAADMNKPDAHTMTTLFYSIGRALRDMPPADTDIARMCIEAAKAGLNDDTSQAVREEMVKYEYTGDNKKGGKKS